MTFTVATLCFAVATILFVLAAIPPTEPYRGRLMSVGLAFFAAGHVLP